MSSADLTPAEFHRLRERVLDLYSSIIAVMIVGIAILTAYIVLAVGPLTSPGAQESFGLALALAFLMGTVAVHLVDRMYRVWPLGRTVHPARPAPIGERDVVRAFRWAVVVATAASVAYLLGLLLTS